MKTRTLIATVSVVAACTLAATAWAKKGQIAGEVAHHFMRARIEGKVNDALDAVKATAPQRAQVQAAVEHVIDTFGEGRAARHAGIDRAIALFEGDTLDPAAVSSLREQHIAATRAIGDAVVQSVYDIHDALTPGQRQALVAHLRAEMASHGAGRERHHGLMKHMIGVRIDDALDEASVSAGQRAAIHAARDKAFAAVEAAHETPALRPAALLEEVAQIFLADTIDPAKVKALRERHEAQARTVGDAIVSAVGEAHAALTPAQRKAVAEHVRTELREHGMFEHGARAAGHGRE